VDVDDDVNNYYPDELDGSFSIIGTISVTQPDGSNWKILQTGVYNVTCSASGVSNVSAYYSTSNGAAGTYNFIGSATVSGGTATIPWDTPDSVSDTVKVKVIQTGEDVDTTPIAGESPTFSLFEEFTNIQPSNGANLTANDSTTITWNKLGNSLANVNLYLSKDNGSNYTLINTVANTGSASWTVPTDVRSIQCKIKVESDLNSNNYAESNGVFVIKNRIDVTNPTTGTPPWNVGSTYTISWDYLGPNQKEDLTPVQVKIEYSYSGNEVDYTTIATGVDIGTAGSGSWDWTIANDTTLGTTAKIRVTDTEIATATGTSQGDLVVQGDVVPDEITTDPLKVGDPYDLSWTRYGAVTQVNLYYSKDGAGGPWVPIVSSWDATQNYPWSVPDDITDTLRIKVEDTNNTSVSNITNNDVRIIGKIQLDSPDVAEPDWVVGESRDIKFTTTGTYSVKIQGSTNGFADESETWDIVTISSANITSGVQYTYSPVDDKISDTVKIRVADADPTRANLVKDISFEAFKIKGKLKVLYPDTGSEVWIVGDMPNIQWQKTGSISTISIDYSNNNGSNWNTIIASKDASVGYYNQWQIPDEALSLPNQAFIRITDTSDSSVTDTSDNGFTIRGALSVDAPTTGENLQVFSEYYIKWTRKGNFSTVKIQYSIDDGAYINCRDASDQEATAVDASQGASGFPWYVPDNISSNVKIKIIDNDDPTNVYAISGQFNIVGQVTFEGSSIPQAGEKWSVGTSHTIKWSTVGSIATVNISYSTDGGSNYNLIQSAAGNSGSTGIIWDIPNQPGIVSTNAILQIIDPNHATSTQDTSPIFKIVPNFSNVRIVDTGDNAMSEVFANNTDTFWIKWDAYGFNPYVKLYYSTDNFSSPGTPILDTDSGDMDDLIDNDEAFLWQVPDVISNNVQVRVAYSDDDTVNADSGVFGIVPEFTVVAPNSSADEAQVHQDYTIRWTCSSANVDKVRIFYSTDGGNTYPYEITQAPNYADNTGAAGAERTYIWNVDDAITSQFKIKITDTDPVTLTAEDETDFNAKIKAWFNLLQPNGGQIFYVDQNDAATDIQWQWEGSITNVKLQYCNSTDCPDENNWANAVTINASTPNDGSYTYAVEGWQIPDYIFDEVKIRVSDADTGHPVAYDTSDNYFKIKGILEVISPNSSADKWDIGNTYQIKWHTTGTIPSVKIIAYTTDPNDLWFRDGGGTVYTLSNPLVIENSYANNANADTTYDWLVPDKASDTVKIRIIDPNDVDGIVYDDSDETFTIRGSFIITSPASTDRWVVDTTEQITWLLSGSSVTEAKIIYSIDGGSNWNPIIENEGTPNDGIVTNDGSIDWVIPDVIAASGTTTNVLIKIEDPSNSEVSDTSDTFKIIGGFTIDAPEGGERWVTNENHMISWTTAGSIDDVNIYYFKDGNTFDLKTIDTNYVNTAGSNSKVWTIPDPASVYGIDPDQDLPISVQVRIEDADDSSVYADSPVFNIDYYYITWDVRDFLTNMPIAGGLSVDDTSGWIAAGLSSETPITHATPYGAWSAAWEHEDYGSRTKDYVADSDQSFTIYLESKVVHVWEAITEYVYDPVNDKLTFSSTLTRDGSVVTGAQNCEIEILNYDGQGGVKTLTDNTPDDNGFFAAEWANTGLDTSKTYNALTIIENVLGGIFKTPFLINVAPAVSLQNVVDTTAQTEQTMTTKLDEQATLITNKMDEQTQVIVGEGKTAAEVIAQGGMVGMVEESLASFETQANEAITQLQSGAEQAVEAGQQASEAATELEATAKKYSWNATVSPNPALVGDAITLQCQGQSGKLPTVNIYSWDNKSIIRDQIMTETTPGLYVFEFAADDRFDPGKAYTYIISEPVTGGLVAGSGTVESMSITTVAGLASAAPAAERAAKKALEAIQAVEAVLVSDEPINIGLTLKNLEEQVEELPEAIAKEGPSAYLTEAVNDIAQRLDAIAGEEGFDLSALLEEALGESPTIKEIRNKTDNIQAVIHLLQMLFEAKFGGLDTPIVSTSLTAGSVIFKVVAVNPSKTRTQVVPIKIYLPQEVKADDILDLGGLELEFDEQKSIYYLYKSNVKLTPAQSRVFEVEVKDVWIIPDEKLLNLNKYTESILERLKDTEYYANASKVADSIYKRLDDIGISQRDETVSRQQHIGIYRNNLKVLDEVEKDIARLEKTLATAGGPLAPEMLAKTKIKAQEPTKTATWIVIFVIIIFIGLLALVLFFTWHHQAKLTEDSLTRARQSAFAPPAQEEDADTDSSVKGE
jgi:hypothetical protein